jgi:predicted chitinase
MMPRARSLALPSLVALTAAALAACSGAPTSDGAETQAEHLSSAQCSSASAWSVGTSYTVGAVVSFDGKVYTCIQAHTALDGWTPAAVPALWGATDCASGGGGKPTSGGSSSGGAPSSGGGSSSSGGSASSGGGSSTTCGGWIYMADAHSCDAHIGSSCGWTTSDEGQGYHCKDMGGWVGCEPGGGGACSGGSSSGGSSGGTSGSGGSGGSGGGSTTTSGGIGALLSEATFDAMFPNRNPVYSYAGLIQAASKYSAFGGTGDDASRKREIAAFLANVAHETGGLVYTDEIAKADYYQPSPGCPCAPGKQYYGRGSLQLSWNFNYCAAGAALGEPLQASPELVASDSRLAWLTGVWFWMTSTGAGSTTPHDAIDSGSFGGTIRAINGSIECNGGNPGEVQDRVQYYTSFCAKLGVDPGSNTGC